MVEPSFLSESYYFKAGDWEQASTHVIVEKAVTLSVNGHPWLDFMCTPIDLKAMAVGFLYNEGLVKTLDDFAAIRVCDNQENIDVWLKESIEKPKYWRRTSGCTGGVTSVEDLYHIDNNKNYHNNQNSTITPESIVSMIGQLLESQTVYRISGGVHTSAISDGEQICITAEDIGRHNSLDKLAGLLLLDDIKLERKIIVTTGRISSEMLQKSAQLGASIVISRTSPSSLSIELANIWGVTLIGYARRDQFRVYSHHERVLFSHPETDYKHNLRDL